jgi:hypothetical protein
VIYRLDGRPTVVVPGTISAWRAIDEDTSDGIDVLQLETFLGSAGFDADGDLDVDSTVDDATIEAIEDWQTSLGIEPTGRIEFGEVVFLPDKVTVVATDVKVGAVLESGDAVLDVRTGTPYVDVDTDASWVSLGSEVSVSLDGQSTKGTVTTFSGGIARVSLPATTTARDGSTATVTLQRTKVDGALLVPASAILRADAAGPTVQVRRDDTWKTVRVEVLAAANGTAAIKATSGGELAEGEEVLRY